MNNIIYFFLSREKKLEPLSQKYIDALYNYYEYKSAIFHCSVNINKDEFQHIFECIYSILLLRISKEDFNKVCEHYLKCLIADAIDGDIIDTRWFIEHICYLSVGISNAVDVKKYNDCIPYIQEKLIKQFNISETIREKVSRKLYTKFMVK